MEEPKQPLDPVFCASGDIDWGDYAVLPDQVHVWCLRLEPPPAHRRRLELALSVDERQRADRFLMPADRHRFAFGRGALRLMLARCLGTAPDQVRFESNAFGKPRLADDWAQTRLQFNVSHSGNVILIALALGRELGIDVERMRPDLEVETIADRYFSPQERSTLASLPALQRQDAFFTCWTRKEAFIKAVGKGLSRPLDEFDVSLRPGDAPQLLETRPDPAEARCWEMQELDVGPGHKAAIVVEGAGWQLQKRDWPGRDARCAAPRGKTSPPSI